MSDYGSDYLQCYRILEVEPGASLEEIKRAYRELARVWHPDRFPNDPRLQSKAQEKLKQINLAYEEAREKPLRKLGTTTWQRVTTLGDDTGWIDAAYLSPQPPSPGELPPLPIH